ncbi:MAG: hypothetical protein LBJ59_10180 [Zoogloeaceae bacterium]|nr:hypothetical protein [Zoogloeaceae bacterium]
MPKPSAANKTVVALTHDDARKNIPSVELEAVLREEDRRIKDVIRMNECPEAPGANAGQTK